MLYWDRYEQQAVLWNLEDGTDQAVEGLPGPASYVLSPDRRTVYGIRLQSESDLWLVRLGEAN